MFRSESMKIIVASNNQGKLKEFKSILEPLGYTVVTAKEQGISMDSVEETGATFVENSIIKAAFVHEQTGLPTIADDSGLTISALPDILGVYSARFMGEDTPYVDKNNEILKRLKDESQRDAYFTSAIVMIDEQGIHAFEGRIDGSIAEAIMGEGGFGYDPIFVPNGMTVSFGMLDADVKNKISHRALALQKFIDFMEA